MPSLRVLSIAPEPIDAAWSPGVASAWAALNQSLRGLRAAGLELSRLTPCTANALHERLARESFDALHVIGRGVSRPAAKHGTLTLEASDRRARDWNVQNFAKTCASIVGLKVVVVHSVGAPGELDMLCDVLQGALPVVRAPAGNDSGFEQAFYAALGSGVPLGEAFASAARAAGSAGGTGAARLVSHQPQLRAASQTPLATGPSASPIAEPPTPLRSEPPLPRLETPEAQLTRKREAGAFDVFLCHNVGDKPAVAQIALQLMARGVLPWLDAWELRPGLPWQRILEEQITKIRAAAVFVGPGGIGPWQRHELDGFLREFNTRGCPVIPVMLPVAGAAPELPLFLRGITWVDFRVLAPDPLSQLLWGITGSKPDVHP